MDRGGSGVSRHGREVLSRHLGPGLGSGGLTGWQEVPRGRTSGIQPQVPFPVVVPDLTLQGERDVLTKRRRVEGRDLRPPGVVLFYLRGWGSGKLNSLVYLYVATHDGPVPLPRTPSTTSGTPESPGTPSIGHRPGRESALFGSAPQRRRGAGGVPSTVDWFARVCRSQVPRGCQDRRDRSRGSKTQKGPLQWYQTSSRNP